MALRTLLLRKKLSDKQAEQANLRKTEAGYKTRESEITKAIEEASTDEEKAAVASAVDELEKNQAATTAALDAIAAEIKQLQTDIADAEAKAAAAAAGEGAAEGEGEDRSGSGGADDEKRSLRNMSNTQVRLRSRSRCFETRAARKEFFERSEIKTFIAEVRSRGEAGMNTRAVGGAGLGVPVEMLALLRDNLDQYSKLLQYTTVVPLSGVGRQTISGDIPEGVWMEAFGDLNNLDITFTQVEVDAYMVGGYIAIHQSYLKDSDIRLGEEILYKLGQGIGYAIDKAIPYGTGVKMPVGFITRLAASSQPAWWGTNEGTFTDLHTANVLTLNIDSLTGAAFFSALALALAKAKPNYSNGQPVWIMNRYTHIALMVKAMAFDAGGALVSMLKDEMPIIGGRIVEQDRYMDNNTIAGGYMSLQVMAEREGAEITSSEHIFFLKNQTVFKGFARYDGRPLKGEGFVIVRWDNNAPTTTKTFASDYANTDLNALIVTSAAGSTLGDSLITVTGKVSVGNALKYKAGGQQTQVVRGQTVPSTWTALTSGTDITVATGKTITVVELDSDSKVISVGNVTAVAKDS